MAVCVYVFCAFLPSLPGWSRDFYLNYDAKEHVKYGLEYGLMMHNAGMGASTDRLQMFRRWLEAEPLSQQLNAPPPFDEPPPNRSNFPLGAVGRKNFRQARAVWYRKVANSELCGDVAEQNDLFDRVARRYRAYSDGRLGTRRQRASRDATAAADEAAEDNDLEAAEERREEEERWYQDCCSSICRH